MCPHVRLIAINPSAYLMGATELKVRDIEIATHVPKKFRFPYFIRCVLVPLLCVSRLNLGMT